MTDLTIVKINGKTPIILFNNALRQVTPMLLVEAESVDYGKYIVTVLNEVAIFKYYEYDKIINISKDEMENQTRLNFHLSVNYNSKKTASKIPLVFNVILLYEHLYDDGDQVMNKVEKDISTYLDTFRLLGLPNKGFIPGTIQ